MSIYSGNSFPGIHCPPQEASSNRHVHVFPAHLATLILPGNLASVSSENEWLLEDSTHIKPCDQTIDTVIDAAQIPKLLQHHSPIIRLPPEILACIFRLYVACLRESPKPDGVLSHGPFCLVQVCTLWRTVAESDPRLWTSIHFYFPESHESREEDAQRVQPVFDLHLKRSGALPISLTFADHRLYHSSTEELISLLVDRLRTHAQRWKRISLQLAGGYFPLLFTFTPCDVSSLEHLCINGNTVVFARPIMLHLNLKSAVNLKSFNYSGLGPSAEDKIHLPWGQLAEVSFEFAPHHRGDFTVTPYRRLIDLARCQSITTCSLGIDRPPPFGISRNITLPCLQTLRVRRLTPYAHASGALHPLILPQLQTLEIDASNLVIRNQRWHERTFSDLLARSGCSLLRLSIQDVDFPNDELVRCLALSPALMSFRFIPCPRSQDIRSVIREMDAGGQTQIQEHRQEHVENVGPLVPQLREITLASSVEIYLEEIMMMFRSRVGPRALATLRRAQVVFVDLWHDMGAIRVRGSGDRDLSERVASFRAELARWVDESRNENGQGDGDGLEASVVVDSPYLPEYIDVQ
ncbi:hypothetical protein L210DRAFT_3650534 [Boletus edulis BED1]|uniref:F-box domain-containing protein n=1 Tax=Boletus edulis BED1 TaxID=1328754 RepID=A0AAD4BJF7_BOLED|nr:hypothetical protein L210DRAFT_3650534 [Boletus edulis BED1]